jgi:catechol 2,3-dioxygenase-like lactoylglutathione lyase family enzyme
MTVADMDRSVAFFHDVLTFEKIADCEFNDDAFDRLEGVFGARVRITGLRAPEGPGIEFLQYLTPRDGRPFPADAQPSDIVHWQTALFVQSTEPVVRSPIDIAKLPLGRHRATVVRDPDGHALQLTEP